ncbi:MAG: YbhN family protein [Halobacteriaceae archaeon]
MILTPGKLGEVWKSWLIRDYDGTSISTTMPVIVTERITDLLGVAAISLLGIIAFDRSPLLLLVLLVPLGGGVLILQNEQFCYWLLDHLKRFRVVGQRAEAAKNLYTTTVLSVFSWGLECVGMWLVLRGFGADIELLVAAFVFAISSILGALSLLPGGLGVTEASMTGLLLVFEVNRVTAASSTLIIRAATLWFVAGAALVVYFSYERHTSKDIRDPDRESNA